MGIIYFFVSLVLVSYSIFIVYIIIQFEKNAQKSNLSEALISIIIPCRNEAFNIIECLESISKQSIFNNDYEVIVIDDHSEDNTFEIASNYKDIKNLRVIKNNLEGKKNALSLGISLAKNNLILTTDADCKMAEKWAENMRNIFISYNLNMLCAPINFIETETIFSQLQQAESAAIVGLSATMLNTHKPTTCNGANLMFSKTVFNHLGGYAQHANIATGDDDLLLQQFYKLDKQKVAYTIHKDSMVYTQAATTFENFIHQRSRWLAKRKLYIYPYNKYLQSLIALHLIAFYFAFFVFTPFSLSLIALKYLVDIAYSIKLKQHFSFKIFTVILMPFYQNYIFILLLSMPFVQPKWKGRKLN